MAVFKDVPTKRRRPVLIRELLLALGILLLFLFGGYILQLLGPIGGNRLASRAGIFFIIAIL
ncbi:MAG: hypothetical protein IPJ55_15830 [Chloracidobacterium sp.]|nr:hypothetical protein [Chloracidobacterium sp.]